MPAVLPLREPGFFLRWSDSLRCNTVGTIGGSAGAPLNECSFADGNVIKRVMLNWLNWRLVSTRTARPSRTIHGVVIFKLIFELFGLFFCLHRSHDRTSILDELEHVFLLMVYQNKRSVKCFWEHFGWMG